MADVERVLDAIGDFVDGGSFWRASSGDGRGRVQLFGGVVMDGWWVRHKVACAQELTGQSHFDVHVNSDHTLF